MMLTYFKKALQTFSFFQVDDPEDTKYLRQLLDKERDRADRNELLYRRMLDQYNTEIKAANRGLWRQSQKIKQLTATKKAKDS